MHVINAQNVYSIVLTETEWYAGTDQQREAWQVQCRREADAAGCRYCAVLVEPDPLLSISPIGRRHAVWRYAAPTTAEEDFRNDLIAVRDMRHTDLTAPRMRAICAEVFGT